MTEERFVCSFDGTELFVSRAGSGPPVVLCDGIGCDGFILHYLQPKLRDRYTLVTWHYRGHGKSAAPADPNAVGIPELRQDLMCVLDALGIERAVLLGFSMGVQLSLDFAVHHPERVAGLVPMCGSYGQPLETFHDTQLADTLFPLGRELVLRYPDIAQRAWSALWRSEFAYQWGTHFEVEGRLICREAFQPYFDHLAGMDVTLFFRMLDKVRHHSVAPELYRVTAPTLVVAGERDTFTPMWLSRRMQRLIPGAEILEVPFGTHTAPLEMPELVCLRVCSFLDENVRPLFEKESLASPAENGGAGNRVASEPVPERAAAKKATRKKPARGKNGRTPTSG